MKIVRPVMATVGGVATGVRDLNRLQEVIRILAAHGLGILVSGISIPGVPQLTDTRFDSTPARAADAIQKLGPTFVKLGQVLSTRPDILPEAYCNAFEQLQDDVGTIPMRKIASQLENAFGPEWRDRVDHFDDTPLATASIAQVHRATLKDGREVVLKVQRSGIASKIRSDLNILNVIARAVLAEYPEARAFDPRGILDEFERSILSELDFLKEAQHMKQFAANFEDDLEVRIPFVVDELTTEDVLCMEFLKGTPMRKAREAGHDMTLVGSRYLRVAYDMLFVHGFFHGDLHPGNVLVLEGGVLGLLDFGMVGRLTREMRRNVLIIMVASERGDHRTVARLMYDIAIKEDRIDYAEVERDTMEILERNLSSGKMADIQIGRLVTDLTQAAAKHGARVPQQYTMFFKALLTSEGLAKSLLHEQDPIAAARPYFQKMLMEDIGPGRLQEELSYYTLTLTSLGARLPVALSQLLEDIDQQRITLNIRHEVDAKELEAQDRRVNRMMMLSIAGVLCLAGSIALLADSAIFFGLPCVSMTLWALAVPPTAAALSMMARNRG